MLISKKQAGFISLLTIIILLILLSNKIHIGVFYAH